MESKAHECFLSVNHCTDNFHSFTFSRFQRLLRSRMLEGRAAYNCKWTTCAGRQWQRSVARTHKKMMPLLDVVKNNCKINTKKTHERIFVYTNDQNLENTISRSMTNVKRDTLTTSAYVGRVPALCHKRLHERWNRYLKHDAEPLLLQ